MANAAEVTFNEGMGEVVNGGYTTNGAKLAVFDITIDEDYAQGGYTVQAIPEIAALDATDLIALWFMGPAFEDSIGGDCFIPSYYPSADKIQLYRVTEAVAGTNLLEERADGALAADLTLHVVALYR